MNDELDNDIADTLQPYVTIDAVSRHQTPTMESTRREETSRPRTDIEEALLRITTQFTSTLQDLASKFPAPPPSRTPPRYTFSGLDHEDPEIFLKQMEMYFRRLDIHEDAEIIDLLEAQLKGEARRWFEPYRHLMERYFTFRERFVNHFNSSARISNAMAKLYGEKQGSADPVAVFITRKRSLFHRLDSRVAESLMVKLILDQLKPDVKSRLRNREFNTVEELVGAATQVEADLRETDRPSWRSAQPRQTPPATTTSFPPRRDNAYNPPRRDNVNNYRRPPTPCRFCQESHFNSDCPQNPYKQGNFTAGGSRPNPASAQPAQTREITRARPIQQLEIVEETAPPEDQAQQTF